jgi:hypothetical protein
LALTRAEAQTLKDNMPFKIVTSYKGHETFGPPFVFETHAEAGDYGRKAYESGPKSEHTSYNVVLTKKPVNHTYDFKSGVLEEIGESDDFFCIGADGNLWILGNHGDIEAAEATAKALDIQVVCIFGSIPAQEWRDKLVNALKTC